MIKSILFNSGIKLSVILIIIFTSVSHVNSQLHDRVLSIIKDEYLPGYNLLGDIKNYPRNRIFFAPLNTIDPINPSIQFGYERMLSNKYSAQVEYGQIMKRSLIGFTAVELFKRSKDYWSTYSGYKLRGEVKRYFENKKTIEGRKYLSVELFYLKNKSNVDDLFIVGDTTFQYTPERPIGATHYEDFFIVDKKKYGINFKLGFQLLLTPRWDLEGYVGLGYVHRKTEHYNRMNINDVLFDEVVSFHNKRGSSHLFNLPLNIKLGYRF